MSGEEDWGALNGELRTIVADFRKRVCGRMSLKAITPGSILVNEK